MAASMVTATIIAAPQPIMASIGMPATCRPAMATTTVTPAKSDREPGGGVGAADGLGDGHAGRRGSAGGGRG